MAESLAEETVEKSVGADLSGARREKFLSENSVGFSRKKISSFRKTKKEARRFLANFAVIYPDEELCELRARAMTDARKQGNSFGTADAWVASVALMFGIRLVTGNRKHFQSNKGLQIISKA